MKKSFVFMTTLLLSLTITLVAVPNSAAQNPVVTELWSDPMHVNDVAVSRNGNYIAAVNDTGLFFFWWNQSTPLWWYNNNTIDEQFLSVAISADGSYVIVGNNSYPPTAPSTGSIYYFGNCTIRAGHQATNGYNWTSSHFFGEGTPSVERGTIDISDNGEYVAVGGTGYNLYMFFNSTKRSGSGLNDNWSIGVGIDVWALDMSPDGQYIAFGGGSTPNGFVAFVIHANTMSYYKAWNAWNLDAIRDIAISDDGSAVCASGRWGNLSYWADAKALTGNPSSTWNSSLSFGCIDTSSDGDMVVAGSVAFSLHLWDNALARSGSNSPETWTNLYGEDIYDVAISDDGKIIAAVMPYGDGPAHVCFFTDQNVTIGNFTEPPGLTMLSMSGDGRVVAAGGDAEDSLHVFYIAREMNPVGGELIVLDKLTLLAPYLALVALVAGTAAAGALLRKRIP
jgi:WD40 repeat protein